MVLASISYIMEIVMMVTLEKVNQKEEVDMIGHVVPHTLVSLKRD